MQVAEFDKGVQLNLPKYRRKPASSKVLKGVDVFVDWKGGDANLLAAQLSRLNRDIALTMITNRGVKVWPEGFEETFCTDHWRCRFKSSEEGKLVTHDQVVKLLQRFAGAGLDFIKTEHLYTFDDKNGFSE